MVATLKNLEYQPVLTISKDVWVPAARQITELDAEMNATRKGYMERRMMAKCAEVQAAQNAEIQARNYSTKKRKR
jgi:hypothetical protein